MISGDNRYVISYNGEIYNFQTLRRELARRGHTFRGHSDTEVLLAAVCEWGLERALESFNGMFAFALWDRHEQTLHLACDRLGEKPLYYGWSGTDFLFGSELKVLRAHPGFTTDINRDALALYFRYNCIPAPYSIYNGIRKMLPGTRIVINRAGKITGPIPYWSARNTAERGVSSPFEGSEKEATEQLDALLRDAVKLRMESDVPLGAFLSGGVDSSVVVALMQAQSRRPVKTFTIGLHHAIRNEALYAKEVAQHLGTEHTELYVTPEQVLDVVPKLPYLYDEPFADSSQIPTFLVSELARRHVTVSLSGDGGDELFAGYHRHFWGVWQKIDRYPSWMRALAARGTAAVPEGTLRALWHQARFILPRRARHWNPVDKLQKLSAILPADSVESLYVNLVSHWQGQPSLVLGAEEPPTAATNPQQWAKLADPTQRIMYLDMIGYLPNDILTKLDRASMGVSLESRVPLLDHRVVEFAWGVPFSMKVRDGQGKWLLRQVLYKYVPRELIERPKAGFGVPIGEWLRGALRDWAEALLSRQKIKDDALLDATIVRRLWTEYLAGRDEWQYILWDILMLQAWLECYCKIGLK
jgi:asparagine synthase (glutamine-hydrolysing)